MFWALAWIESVLYNVPMFVSHGGEITLIPIQRVLQLGACSAIITHCFYLPPPQLLLKGSCNVVFDFFFLVCLFVQKKIPQESNFSRGSGWTLTGSRGWGEGGGHRLEQEITFWEKSLYWDANAGVTSFAHLSTDVAWPSCSLVTGRSFWFHQVKLR